jgi:cob(I)alamin adenosyltransferase
LAALERGLYQVYTGNGKGKTTCAVGLAIRACGAGLKIAFIQFVKGGPQSSELAVLENLGVEVIRPGKSPTGLLRGGPTGEDFAVANECLMLATEAIQSGRNDLVVLDELHIALHAGLLDPEVIMSTIKQRPLHVEVVSTGRRAPSLLVDNADLVTEFREEKHPLRTGITARKGIEF